MWAEASDLLWELEPDGEVTWCGSRASHVSLTSAVRRTAAGKQHVLNREQIPVWRVITAGEGTVGKLPAFALASVWTTMELQKR